MDDANEDHAHFADVVCELYLECKEVRKFLERQVNHVVKCGVRKANREVVRRYREQLEKYGLMNKELGMSNVSFDVNSKAQDLYKIVTDKLADMNKLLEENSYAVPTHKNSGKSRSWTRFWNLHLKFKREFLKINPPFLPSP